MGLVVINPGLFATVQDLGRVGYRAWGIPPGGAFDRGSAALANALLGNPAGCAVVELTLLGGVYEARIPLALALAGAPMSARVDRPGASAQALRPPQSFSLTPTDRLVLGWTPVGARTYLAVKGGWLTPPLLGSRSREERLRPGDVLEAQPGRVLVRLPAPGLREPHDRRPLRIIDGPDAALVSGFDAWVHARFRVGGQVDRMGVRLEGPPVTVASPPERISTPMAAGGVQVAGGQLLLLGVACGTIGGYPHVAHVISADIDRVGQLRPGDTLELRRISIEEARRIDQVERQMRSQRLQSVCTLAGDPMA
jgi:biotin-dependent carboxylase-like uncharacterized protein